MSTRHYLDHASTTPLRRAAREAIAEFYTSGLFGDPGRPFVEGRQSSAIIECARDQLAVLLGVGQRSVVFTSSGTESANWVNVAAREPASRTQPIVCAGVEHSAVRLAAERLGPVIAWRVDREGRVDLDHLDDLLAASERPALVHCQYANHETGTVQPVSEVVARCRERGVVVHIDACAAIGQIEIDLGELDADLVSLSGHKFGAPTGIGALVIRRGVRPQPLLVGGDQERARRAGMENVAAIVGLGAVAEMLARDGTLAEHTTAMRRHSLAIEAVLRSSDGVAMFGDRVNCLPHIVCAGLAGVEAEGVVLGLDQSGIAVHSGSACSSEDFEPSPVLAAMGVDADHSLRVSVGWSTTQEDVEAFRAQFPLVLDRLRALGRRD